MKRAFERLKKKDEETKREQRVNMRGAVTMTISATDLTDLATGERNLPEMTSMSISQNVKAPFSQKDVATIGATVMQRNGNGASSLALGWRRNFSAKSYGFCEVSRIS